MILRSIILLLIVSLNGYCISDALVKKYPYTLVTDDYGILNEKDLVSYTGDKEKSAPFSGEKDQFSLSYWQCFSRDNITITYVDMGPSDEGAMQNDTLAYMPITVYVKPGVLHEYSMRALNSADLYEERLHKWRKIMKSEPYVCLAGEFGRHEQRIREYGANQEAFTWTFDMIKTKKGCDSYFEPCN